MYVCTWNKKLSILSLCVLHDGTGSAAPSVGHRQGLEALQSIVLAGRGKLDGCKKIPLLVRYIVA